MSVRQAWAPACRAFGLPGVIDDPRFAEPAGFVNGAHPLRAVAPHPGEHHGHGAAPGQVARGGDEAQPPPAQKPDRILQLPVGRDLDPDARTFAATGI